MDAERAERWERWERQSLPVLAEQIHSVEDEPSQFNSEECCRAISLCLTSTFLMLGSYINALNKCRRVVPIWASYILICYSPITCMGVLTFGARSSWNSEMVLLGLLLSWVESIPQDNPTVAPTWPADLQSEVFQTQRGGRRDGVLLLIGSSGRAAASS